MGPGRIPVNFVSSPIRSRVQSLSYLEASEHEKTCVGYQETPKSSKRSAFEASFESFYES